MLSYIYTVLLNFDKQAAEKFVTDNSSRLTFGSRKLYVAWQTDFFNDKPEYTDKFRPEVLDKTVYVAGFDRQVGFDKTAEPLRIFLSLYLSIHNNETKNRLMIN